MLFRSWFSRIEDAIASYVRYVEEISPDSDWAQTYTKMQPTFDRLYAHSQALYDDLDALIAAP